MAEGPQIPEPHRRGRRSAVILSALASGLLIGLLSAWASIGSSDWGIRRGIWAANSLTGSPDADPYTRARVAKQALLAMQPSQSVYFTAETDAEGRRLRGDCRYELSGEQLPARWWSVTIYADDYFLIENPADRYSVTAQGAGPGQWRAQIAADGGADLVSAAGRPFNLLLRLYHPEISLHDLPADLSLPRLERGDCS